MKTKVHLLFAGLLFSFLNLSAFNVTLRVDLSQQTPAATISVAGDFQVAAGYATDWTPGITVLTDPDMDQIYELTVSLPAGSYQYKFINGTMWGQDESVPAGCAMSGNREMTISSDTTLPAVCFGSCVICSPPQTMVTFQVDMSQQSVDTSGVHIAGSFQNWNPSGTPMTNQGNGIWTYSTLLNSGDYYEYKFINGNAWGSDETVPTPCASNSNRFISVPTTTTTLPAVCFASCSVCPGGAPLVNVTFQVDMSQQTVDTSGVHIAGSFQGWDPAATLMTNQGGGIWTYITQLDSGGFYEYKFVNGDAWGKDEIVPGACASGTNRFLDVPAADTTLPAYCFASCAICVPPPPQSNVTFQVDMSQQTVDSAGVFVAGNFQGWDPAVTALTNMGNGIWAHTATLDSGYFAEYKFINGNAWGKEEAVPGACSSLSGNRTHLAGDTDTTLQLVCFASCDTCVSPVNITFQVNLFYETVSDSGVHLVGDFNGFDPTASKMIETAPGSKIFTYVVTLPGTAMGSTQTYKFLNGNQFGPGFQEDVAGACGDGYGNRIMTVAAGDQTLPLVCFQYCEPCSVAQKFVDVNFTVDMRFAGGGNGVSASGTFNTFSPGSDPLTETMPGSGLYSTTLTLLANKTYRYKFVNDNGVTYEPDPDSSCTDGSNRILTTGNTNTNLPVVCFGSCSTCPVCPDNFEPNDNIGAAANLYGGTLIAGQGKMTICPPGDEDFFLYQNQIPGATIRARLDHQAANYHLGLMNVTGMVLDSSVNPGTAPEIVEYAGAPKGIYYLRVWGAPGEWDFAGNYRLSVSSLLPSPSGGGIKNVLSSFSWFRIDPNGGIQLYPNPASDELSLRFPGNAEGMLMLELQDMLGRTIKTFPGHEVVAGEVVRLELNGIGSGNYLLRIQSEAGVIVHKVQILAKN